jgi:O-antigen ligase
MLTFVVTAFVFLSSIGSLDIIDRILYGEWEGKAGDRLTQILHLLFLSACLLLFWWGSRTRHSRLNQVLPLAAAGLLLISASWSVNPFETIKHAGEYLCLVLGAIGIVKTLDNEAIINLILLAVGLSVIASIISLLISPDAALMDDGLLRGVFSHKNMLGQAMAVGVLAGLHYMRLGRRPRSLYIFLTGLFTVMVVVSRSATSVLMIISFFIIHILAALYVRGGIARIIGMFMGIVALGGFVFVTTNSEMLLDLIGKDPTLTGRTDLWPYVIDVIYQKPLLGWGFGAFWLPSNPAAGEIAATLGWLVPEAHNGMLGLLLETGAVGTAYFVFLLGRNLIISLRCIKGPTREIGISALLFFVGIVAAGVSEAVLLAPEHIFTLLFFLLGFMCEKTLGLAREARQTTHIRYGGIGCQSWVYSLARGQPTRSQEMT